MPDIGYVLTINVGNSNTVFSLFAGEKYLGKWRMETRTGRTADEYGLWLLDIFNHINISAKHITGVAISTVVPTVEMVLTSMARRFFNVEPVHIVPGIKTGMRIQYGRAGDLGPDRLCNIVALNTYYKNPAIVVDFGTTTSFDVINAEGKYVGGAVAPGIALSLESLSRAAPQLPDVGSVKPEWVIGKNIAHSMQSGCYWGAVDMVNGIIKRIVDDINAENAMCIATGGFAKDMLEGTDIFDEIDTNLTLKGLKLIYDLNEKN